MLQRALAKRFASREASDLHAMPDDERTEPSVTARAGLRLPHLSDGQFDEIRTIVTNIAGIRLPDVKRVMVESRVRRRLQALQLSCFDEYMAYLLSPSRREIEEMHLVDVITTNKTDFFREPAHFELLVDKVLPEFHAAFPHQTLRIWSAACSTGEEPYTLAMVLSEYRRAHPGFDFQVYGTDISSSALKRAQTAVYTEKQAVGIPEALRESYLYRSRDPRQHIVRVAPQLREKVCLGWLNLMDPSYGLPAQMHIVFCRNVLIYFERPTQRQVISRLCNTCRSGGWLFLGHSESVAGLGLPLRHIGPSAFRIAN